MGSIWPTVIIVFAYLYFVLKIGPELMRFRNPINIDRIVLVYNAVQVIFSLYLVKEVRYNYNIQIDQKLILQKRSGRQYHSHHIRLLYNSYHFCNIIS